MTSIVVAPELDRMVVERRGIFTVPAEDSLVACNCPHRKPCNGIRIRSISLENRAFELLAHDMEQRFLERQAARGFELMGAELLLHGPFWSYDFNSHLADISSSAWWDAQKKDRNGDEHPENTLGYVFEVDQSAFNPYRDYLIVGTFLKQAVLTEVFIPDGD